jgi:WD40 repeat protein
VSLRFRILLLILSFALRSGCAAALSPHSFDPSSREGGEQPACRGDNPALLSTARTDVPQLIAQSPHSEDVTTQAYSPRHTLMATGSKDGTVKLWLVKTGQLLQTFSTSSYWVHFVLFSPDGCTLAAGSGDHKIYVWNLDSQQLVSASDSHAGAAESLAFSADSSVLTANTTGVGTATRKPQTIEWEVQGGNKRRQVDCAGCPTHTSPDLDIAAPEPVGRATGVSALYFSQGFLAVGLREGQITVWDKSLRTPIRALQHPILKSNGGVGALWLDKSSGDLYSAGQDGGVARWSLGSRANALVRASSETATGGETTLSDREELGLVRPEPPKALSAWVVGSAPPPPTENMKSVAFSPSGIIATGGLYWTYDHTDVHGVVALWNSTGARVGEEFADKQRGNEEVTALSFSSDGTMLAVGFELGGIDLWDVAEHRLIQHLDEHRRQITALAFSASGKYLASGSMEGELKIWTLNSSGPARTLSGHTSAVQCIRFSPKEGDDLLASGATDNHVIVWRASSGERLHVLEGHTAPVNAVTFSPDGSDLVTGGEDATVRFWNLTTYQPFAALVAAAGGTQWLTTTPRGFFDGSETTWKQVLWQFNGNLFDISPIEIGFRNYFVPNLLEKALANELPATTPSLASLNRSQPAVRIVSVAPDGSGTVRVDVEAVSQDSTTQRDDAGRPLVSGIYDLRLFRNGRLVAMWPETDGASAGTVDNLEQWRREHVVPAEKNGKARVGFKTIRIARFADDGKSEFTAYAFNSDRVKSATSAAFDYQAPPVHDSPARKAYLVTMGVNANQSGFNLDVAVPSAEKARSLLHAKLAEKYSTVIDVPLYSDVGDDGAVKLKLARKDALKAVLDILSGASVDPALRDQVDSNHLLQPATPDDTVVLYIASHGYVDPHGTMYVVPFDTGAANLGITEGMLTRCSLQSSSTEACMQAQSFLQHAISSVDFSAWWRRVDAGEIVMVLDSCHSGALPGRSFRPGPLGDPGFGQLSYDKKMILMSASQPAQTEVGVFLPGGEARTLLVDALEQVAREHPAQSLPQWITGVENQLPVTMSKLFPHTNADDLQSPVLLDFSGSGVQEITTISQTPAGPAQKSTGLSITVH